MLAVWLVLLTPCLADSGYLKLVRDKAGKPVKLQSAIVTFGNSKGQTVTLVSAIHVGEKSYYSRLNQHFQKYDSVLYEMVLDVPKQITHQNNIRELLGREKKEPKIDTTKGGRDAVSLFQAKLAEVLGLSYQLAVINYSADNFHHADLTLEEFNEARQEKNKGAVEILKSLLAGDDDEGPPEYRKISELPMMKILAVGPSPQERAVLKTGLAAYYAQNKDIASTVEGEVLIKQRDKRAVEVLQHRLKKGDKKLAIFYGAAHMPDLAERLKQLGFKPQARSWTEAWKL